MVVVVVVVVVAMVVVAVVVVVERAQILEFKCSYKIIPFLKGLIDFVSFLWGSLEH